MAHPIHTYGDVNYRIRLAMLSSSVQAVTRCILRTSARPDMIPVYSGARYGFNYYTAPDGRIERN